MTENYKRIEDLCGDDGQHNTLSKQILDVFPDPIRLLFKHKVFGENILSLPDHLDSSGHERPFHFINLEEKLNIFNQEFRDDIPGHFHLIGYYYGGDPFILYNDQADTVHSVHVSDVVDLDFLNYKLKKPMFSFSEFMEKIKAQTVTCLIHPKNASQYFVIEMRDGQLYCDHKFIYEGTDLKEQYMAACKEELQKGMEVHYAPNWVLDILSK